MSVKYQHYINEIALKNNRQISAPMHINDVLTSCCGSEFITSFLSAKCTVSQYG